MTDAAEISPLTQSIQYAPLGLQGKVVCIVDANPPVHTVLWSKDSLRIDPQDTHSPYVCNDTCETLTIKRVCRSIVSYLIVRLNNATMAFTCASHIIMVSAVVLVKVNLKYICWCKVAYLWIIVNLRLQNLHILHMNHLWI
jgi:hypothetical protein